MTKIVIEIHMKNMVGGKIIAKTMEKAIKGSIQNVATYPSIDHIESRVE